MKHLIRDVILAAILFCCVSPAWAGATSSNDPNATSPFDTSDGCGHGCGSSKGMPVYSFKSMLASLSLHDTPLSYTPPVGPGMDFTLTYNAREGNQPDTFDAVNLGHKWTLNWLSYIQDDPASPGRKVLRYVAGGGAVEYSGYDTASGEFAPEEHNAAVLVRTSDEPVVYELRFADGRKAVFAQSGGQTAWPRRVYLTKRIDPQGNGVTLHYDDAMRLTAITDAIGQRSTFQYDDSTHPLTITGITDPFGRHARLAYDDQGRLIAVTDAIGLTSTFAYEDDGTFIHSMTTPYGTTTFAQTRGEGSSTELSVQATDPMGFTERTEYRHNAPGIAYSATEAPAGMGVTNSYLNYRNSFYWDKAAYAQACSDDGAVTCDYTQARLKHFLHNRHGQTARVLESIKYPLEGRIWYRYKGQSGSIRTGSFDKPTAVGRVLDDGDTQLTTYAYNARGNITHKVDPEGRETHYTYADNDIDLIRVEQKTADGLQTLARYTYNGQHQPLTYTDAAGQITSYTYNARGQRTSVTDPLGQTTTYVYDSNGYLTTVTNGLGHAQLHLTYDAKGRIASATDSEGHTRQFDYDALNRLTRVTYPDGSHRQFGWQRLDLVSVTDREGRTTRYRYDANRNRIAKIDPMGFTTRYRYYPNGRMKALIDPKGHTTTWKRDLEGRVIGKTYADGAGDTYAYDNSARLISKTDALGQVSRYRYTVADLLAGVDYSNAVNATPSVSFNYDEAYPRLIQMTDGHGSTQYQYYPAGEPGANKLQRVQGPDAHDRLLFTWDALGRLASRTVDGSTETLSYDALGRVVGDTNALGDFSREYLGDTTQITRQSVADVPFQVTYRYERNLNDRRLKALLNETVQPESRRWGGHPGRWQPHAEPQTSTRAVASYGFTTTATGRILSRTATSMESEREDSPGTHRGRDHHQQHSYRRDHTFYHQLLRRLFQGFGLLGHDWHGEGWDHGGSHHGRHGEDGPGREIITTYQYDADARLQSARQDGGVDYDYRYDPAGNLVSIARGYDLTLINPNALNQVANTRQASYRYDANGNLLDDGQRAYTWDAADRLLSITDKTTGHVSTFAYDGFSRRIRETETDADGTTTTIVNLWCGKRLCEQRNSNGTAIARYFAQGEVQAGTPYYYARNQVGSVVAMVDAGGQVAGRTSYGPYGHITHQSGIQPGFAYAALYRHAPSGLYLATYRAYDPAIGRWLSRDPIGEVGGVNLYGYVDGNPVNFADPKGLWSVTISAFAGLGGLVTFGQDPITDQWFYGGGVGVGLGGGASFDYKGRRPGSGASGCGHGTSYGTFGSLGGGYGPYGASIDFSGGRDYTSSPSQTYTNLPALSSSFLLGEKIGVSVGGGIGFEVIGH